MNSRFGTRAVALGFGLALLLLGGVSTTAYVSVRQLSRSNQAVAQTHQTLELLEAIINNLREAERGRRGYVITDGDSAYLKTALLGVQDAQRSAQNLYQLLADDQVAYRQLQAIEPLMVQRLDLLMQSIDLIQNQQSTSEIQIELTHQGRQIQEQIEEQLNRLEAVKEETLQQQTNRLYEHVHRALLAISGGSAVSFSLLIGVILLLQKQVRDRFQAEAERNKLIDILEASPDLITTTTLDARVHYINQAGRAFFGFPATENIEDFDLTQAHPNWALQRVCHEGIPNALREGVWLGETAFVRHDGQEVPTSQVLIAHRTPQGEVSLLSTIARDITHPKQTEASLREANRRWRSLLDNVRLLVVGLDHNGKVEYINPFFLELTGYSESEVLGKDWFSTFLPLRLQQQVRGTFTNVIEHNFHSHYQNPILTKTHEERMIAWNNTQLQDVHGKIIGTMSIGEDVTERLTVERMKSEFISVVSHELRTPLTSIRGSIALLASGLLVQHPHKAQRMLEIAAIDTERLVRLINDILDLERLESGNIQLQKEWHDATHLIQQAVDPLRPLAEASKVTLAIAVSSVKVWAVGDQVVQTLTNLISNAIKFSDADTRVEIEVQRYPGAVLFQVSDQGRGIPADKLETIFGRFQQVDASDARQKGGTGLGLAICRSIVQQHGGQIWAESVPGQGSTFSFTLLLPPEHQLPDLKHLDPDN